MQRPDTIDLAELRALSDRLFARLEESGARSIKVTQQRYWMIFVDQAFDLEREPERMTGDVFDDLRDVRGEATNADFFSPWHAFHHLSALMLAIANADMQEELAYAPAEGDIA